MDIFVTSSVNRDFANAIKIANDNNFNIEISRFGSMVGLDDEFEDRLVFHKNALKNFEGKLSVHGFFFDLNPSTPDPAMLKVTEHRYNQSFTIAKELKAKTVVFHSGYNSLIKHPDYNRDFINYQVVFWNDFIKRFENEGITVAIENTYEFTPDILLQLVDTINSDNLKLAIDTGHTNINSVVDNAEWIEKLGTRLHHMHIHNNFGLQDEHSSLLRGTINFEEIFNTLAQKNLNPNLVLEIFNYEEVLESSLYLQKLLNQVKV